MKLIYPCKSRIITSKYGKRGVGFHNGVDIAGESGDKIISCFDGVVERSYYSNTYGECIVIDHEHLDFSILYAHLLKRDVEVGEKVKHGQVIGLMGTTGNSTGVHLHFEVRDTKYVNSKTTYYKKDYEGVFFSSIDPLQFLAESEDFTSQENKAIIQARCKFNNPNVVWKVMDKHPYSFDLYRKLRESYEEV